MALQNQIHNSFEQLNIDVKAYVNIKFGAFNGLKNAEF